MSTPKPYVMFEVVRRVQSNGAWGTVLYYPDDHSTVAMPICVSLERTYMVKGTNRSKIADGVYHCSKSTYHKGGYPTYELHVPLHDLIKFHKANWVRDLEGCVGLGEKFADFNPAPGIQEAVIAESGAAFEEFMSLAGGVESFFVKFTSA